MFWTNCAALDAGKEKAAAVTKAAEGKAAQLLKDAAQLQTEAEALSK